MTYGVQQEGQEIELTVSAASRDELFRDALKATLEAVYGGPAAEDGYEGQIHPIQAAGAAAPELLEGLLRDCVEAARATPGTLAAPRWLSFDENRVTANFRVLPGRSAARKLRLGASILEEVNGSLAAQVTFRVEA